MSSDRAHIPGGPAVLRSDRSPSGPVAPATAGFRSPYPLQLSGALILALACLAAACTHDRTTVRASDLERGRYACDGRQECWEFTTGHPPEWPSQGAVQHVPHDGLHVHARARISSPPIRTGEMTRLIARIRSSVPVEVWWISEESRQRLIRWKSFHPASTFKLRALRLPAHAAGRLQLFVPEVTSDPEDESGPSGFELSFAEILRKGEGRCALDYVSAVAPPLILREAVLCAPPAEVLVELEDAPAVLRMDISFLGSGSAPTLYVHGTDTEGEHDLVRLEPPKELLWYRTRIDAPTASGLEQLRLRVEGDPSAVVAWTVESIPVRRLDSRPNVLVYLIDTLRADALAPYGSQHPTPHVQALAERGTTFVDAVAPAPWTLPSVASLFTGRNPREHGVNNGHHAVPAEMPLLAESFRAAGYRTAAISTNGFVSHRQGLHRGFTEFVPHFGEASHRGPEELSSRWVSDLAVPWIDEHRTEPFFLYLHVMDPHLPYTIPDHRAEQYVDASWPESETRRELARELCRAESSESCSQLRAMSPEEQSSVIEVSRSYYAASVGYCDDQLGRITAALEQADLTRDTIVLLVSDHGEEFLEHGRTGHGHSLYGELIRIPAILAYPKVVPAGQTIGWPVGLRDFGPYLLSLAGVPPMSGVPGTGSLLDDAARKPRRLLVYGTHPNSSELAAVIEDRWKLICPARTLHDDGNRPHEGCELYDRHSDPFDQHNRAEQEGDVRRRLAMALQQMLDVETAAAAKAPALDPSTRERLRALGYATH